MVTSQAFYFIFILFYFNFFYFNICIFIILLFHDFHTVSENGVIF